MKRSALLALTLGAALFIALLAWRGAGTLVSTLAVAGWGMLAVAAFHLLPLLIDALALGILNTPSNTSLKSSADRGGAVEAEPPTATLIPPESRPDPKRPRHSDRGRFTDVLLARWAGESVNSLLPAGQMGGPVVMARLLGQSLTPKGSAGPMVLIATTQQMLAQALFALIGIALLMQHAGGTRLWPVLLGGVAVFAAGGALFYRVQRRGLFSVAVRWLSRAAIGQDRAALTQSAAQFDQRVEALYRRHAKVLGSFLLHLLGWLVGVGEVWLALRFLGHPVDWSDALLLESLGQAIRGMAFAIPGALGVQEGGYLLLAPLVGLAPETALALSLCKRARELLLGLPGLLYWSWVERSRLRGLRANAVLE